jgi:hypothetical protein
VVHGHFESDGPVQPYLTAGGGTGGGTRGAKSTIREIYTGWATLTVVM